MFLRFVMYQFMNGKCWWKIIELKRMILVVSFFTTPTTSFSSLLTSLPQNPSFSLIFLFTFPSSLQSLWATTMKVFAFFFVFYFLFLLSLFIFLETRKWKEIRKADDEKRVHLGCSYVNVNLFNEVFFKSIWKYYSSI